MEKKSENKISERLKELREDKNLRQWQLAQVARVNSAYISQLESGKKSNPRDGLIKLLCDHFGVAEDWLRHGVGEKSTA